MTDNEYLEAILREQTLAPRSPELLALQTCRDEVESLLRSKLAGSPRIREAGSKRKGTMIRESYDLDITCYYPHDDDAAGMGLREIYEAVERALSENYATERKGSAIRLLNAKSGEYFHVDVVPGRFVEGNEGDVFLYPTSDDKDRLKTNLDVHVAHVRDSGVVDAIRLTKLWRERNRTPAKTFVLELLVIKLLQGKKGKKLNEQLLYVWEQFRDDIENLTVEDPANPNGNDVSKLLNDAVRAQLSYAAATTLNAIERAGWQSTFGEVQADETARTNALRRISVATPDRSKPWRSDA